MIPIALFCHNKTEDIIFGHDETLTEIHYFDNTGDILQIEDKVNDDETTRLDRLKVGRKNFS